MIRKRQDDCEFLMNWDGQTSAYQWQQCNYSDGNDTFCRCLAENDTDCPKKTNKRHISERCWSIKRYAREKHISEFVRAMK